MNPLALPLDHEVLKEVGRQVDLYESRNATTLVQHGLRLLDLVEGSRKPSAAGWAGDRGHAVKLRALLHGNVATEVRGVVAGTKHTKTLSAKGWREWIVHVAALRALFLALPAHVDALLERAVRENAALNAALDRRAESPPGLRERKDAYGEAQLRRYKDALANGPNVPEQAMSVLMHVGEALAKDLKPSAALAVLETIRGAGQAEKRKREAEARREERAERVERGLDPFDDDF
jgi:hypothetical protein